MEAKIHTAIQNLDAFSQGGPAMQAPTAITEIACTSCLSREPTPLRGCSEASPEEAKLAALANPIEAYEAVR